MPLLILKGLPRISKDSLVDVARSLTPTSISALKPRCRAELLCKDFKVGFVDYTEKLHLRTRRAICLAFLGKDSPDRILTKDTKACRRGWEKLLRRRGRASSTACSHPTRLALSSVSQPRCASPYIPPYRSSPVLARAQVVAQRHVQLRQAKFRARMQRRKEGHRNVRNVLTSHKAPGPTKDTEPLLLEIPMEDVQPAPLVYASRPPSPTTPTMSWFCRNLNQARPAQPGPPLPPLLRPVHLVSPVAPMPPSRRAAPAQPVRPVKQAKPVFWGRHAGSSRACTVKAPAPTMPRDSRRTWKPVVRDRILPLTPLPVTLVKPRRFGRINGSQ